MAAKLPEMLHRWNAFEAVYDRYCRSANFDSVQFKYYVDQLKAACTGRGTRANSLMFLHEINDCDEAGLDKQAWRDFYVQLAKELCMDYKVLLKREGLTDDFFFEGDE